MSKFLMTRRLANLAVIWTLAIAAGSGCAARPQSADRHSEREPIIYQPSTASALAFDPPATIGQPMPYFGRDGRALEAFAGYEEQITTYSYTHQRDEIRVQTDFGMLERRAYTDRTSITTR